MNELTCHRKAREGSISSISCRCRCIARRTAQGCAHYGSIRVDNAAISTRGVIANGLACLFHHDEFAFDAIVPRRTRHRCRFILRRDSPFLVVDDVAAISMSTSLRTNPLTALHDGSFVRSIALTAPARYSRWLPARWRAKSLWLCAFAIAIGDQFTKESHILFG